MLMQEQMLSSQDGFDMPFNTFASGGIASTRNRVNQQLRSLKYQNRRRQPNSNRTSIKELKPGAIFTESNIHVQD